MRLIVFLGFILVLLPIAALGHDLYLAYAEETTIDLSKAPQFSDLGWLWVQYSPETYDWARTQIAEESWKELMSPLLRQKSVLMAAIPVGFYGVILGVLKLLGFWPYLGQGLLINRTPKIKTGGKWSQAGKKGNYQYKRK